MRLGSRLLSGASMEGSSMLLEHSLLTSGEVADAGVVYRGWPAKPVTGFALHRKKSGRRSKRV